jgi:hypothetical protein
VYKRPGAADFLQAMAQNYEVVLYTDETNTYADPVLARLDPDGRCISWRLYRQDTQYADGAHVRDLSKLNRDLGRTLFLSGGAGVERGVGCGQAGASVEWGRHGDRGGVVVATRVTWGIGRPHRQHNTSTVAHACIVSGTPNPAWRVYRLCSWC